MALARPSKQGWRPAGQELNMRQFESLKLLARWKALTLKRIGSPQPKPQLSLRRPEKALGNPDVGRRVKRLAWSNTQSVILGCRRIPFSMEPQSFTSKKLKKQEK
jgi:hypothetical protein